MSDLGAIRTGSATPIRLQLSGILRRQIQEGHYPPGSRIPSERDLAQLHGISRSSVRESIAELIQGGLLFRTVGKGTFVSTRSSKMTGGAELQAGIILSKTALWLEPMGFSRMLSGIQSGCRGNGVLFCMEIADGELGPASIPQGYLIVGRVTRAVLDRVEMREKPFISLDPWSRERPPMQPVRIDYQTAVTELVRRLASLGHRSIGFIGFAGSAKYDWYLAALESAGIAADPRQVELLSPLDAEPGIAAGYRSLRAMFDRAQQPSALVAANDMIALGALELLRMRSLPVPGAMSVACFGEPALNTNPPLCTVEADLHLAGVAAAEALYRRISGDLSAEEVIVRAETLPRTSLGPPRAAAQTA